MAEEQPEIPCPDHHAHLSEPDESCKDFIMQQTMLRIKDPKRSLDFYSRVLGMRLVLSPQWSPSNKRMRLLEGSGIHMLVELQLANNVCPSPPHTHTHAGC